MSRMLVATLILGMSLSNAFTESQDSAKIEKTRQTLAGRFGEGRLLATVAILAVPAPNVNVKPSKAERYGELIGSGVGLAVGAPWRFTRLRSGYLLVHRSPSMKVGTWVADFYTSKVGGSVVRQANLKIGVGLALTFAAIGATWYGIYRAGRWGGRMVGRTVNNIENN